MGPFSEQLGILRQSGEDREKKDGNSRYGLVSTSSSCTRAWMESPFFEENLGGEMGEGGGGSKGKEKSVTLIATHRQRTTRGQPM